MEWVTTKENSIHAWSTGLCKTTNKMKEHTKKLHKSNCKKIIQLNLSGEIIKVWKSIISIEKELGINKQNICSACKGKRKTAGGFKWKYLLT